MTDPTIDSLIAGLKKLRDELRGTQTFAEIIAIYDAAIATIERLASDRRCAELYDKALCEITMLFDREPVAAKIAEKALDAGKELP
jgi:hypothetical protein